MKKIILITVFLISQGLQAQIANESELGYNVTNGNSESKGIATKSTTTYTSGKNKYTLFGQQNYSESFGLRSAENYTLKLSYNRDLIDGVFGVFNTFGWQKDNFAGIDQQYSANPGLYYYFWKADDNNYLMTKLGYKYAKTDVYNAPAGTDETLKQNFATFALDTKKQINTNLSAFFVGTFEQNLEEGEDVLFTVNPGVSVVLSSIFNLNISYEGKFDNIPQAAGLKRYDETTKVTLLAKFPAAE